MGIFDAQVDASITPVRPIADQTAGGGASVAGGALSALGNLLGGIAGSGGSGGGEASFTERQDGLQTAIRAQLTEDLQSVNALRADGREQEARDLTRGIIAEATARGVDPSQSWFQETFTAATGMEYEDVVTDPRARAQRALLDSEQGQRLMAIEIARGSSEVDAENAVLHRIAQLEAAAQTIADRNIEWTSGGREAVFTYLDTAFDNGVGGLMLRIQETGYVPSSDEVAFLRHEVNTLATGLQRFRSGAGEEWQDVQNTLDGFNATLDLLDSLSGVGRIEAVYVEAMAFELQEMHQSGDLNAGAFIVALGMLRDPEGWQFMQNDSDAIEALRGMVIDPRVTTADTVAPSDPDLGGTVGPDGETLAPIRRGEGGEIIVGPQVWGGMEQTQRAFEGRSSEELVQEAIAASAFTSGGTPSPDDLNDRSQVMSALFLRMSEVAMRDEFVSASGVDRVFGGRQIGMIDQIAQHNPELARTLLARGYAALEAQGAAVDALIMSHDRQSPAVVLNDRGEITLDFSVLGLDEAQTRRLNEGAAFAYGGSVAEMLRDRGARLAGSEFDDVRQMTRMSVFGGLVDSLDEIMVLTEARTALNRTRAAFGTRLGEMLPEQEATAPETGATAPTTPGETPSGPVGEVPSAEVAYAPYSEIRGYEVFSQDEPFIAAVEQTGSRLGINPEWMLRVMDFETGGDFGTGGQNPESSATGLIGFMAATARGMGTSVEALAQMDRVEQMEYVERYLEPYADRINNVGDLYMAVLYPEAIGEGDDYVLFSEGDGNYGPNANIDRVFGNNDGRVTRGEAVAMMLESSLADGAAAPARELPAIEDLPAPTHRSDLIEDMQFGVFVTPGASSLGGNAGFTMEGASTMTREGADARMAEVLQGPFTEMERIFGARVSILDGVARAGTSRERDTPGSRHFHGDALDLDVASMSNEEKLRLLASAYAAGFRGFGLGEGGLHIDARGYSASWNYTDTYGGLPVATVQGWIESGEFPEEYADILAGAGGAVRPTGGAGGRGPAAGDEAQEVEDWDGATGQLLTAARMDGGGGGGSGASTETGATPTDTTVETADGTPDDSGPVGAEVAAEAAAITEAQAAESVSGNVLRAVDADLPERTMTILRVMGEENAPVAETLDDAYRLISEGVISVGDKVVINGRVSQVTRQMAANAER